MDLRRPHARWRAAVVMLALAAAPGARAQDAAGYVASVNGTWFTSTRPTQAVSAGRVVAQGEQVWAAPRSSAGAYLTVVLRDGNRLALSCAVPGDCDRRHTLRVRAGLLPGAARMVDAVLGLVQRRPEALVPLIARAEGSGPADLVLPRNGTDVDVSAALTELGAGQYRVSLVQLGPGDGQDFGRLLQVVPACVIGVGTWSPGQPLVVRGVPSGLYLLRTESGVENFAESWVLVAPPQEHARISVEFEQAREMVSTWTGIDSAHDARVFLRAYLASLAGLVPAEEPR